MRKEIMQNQRLRELDITDLDGEFWVKEHLDEEEFGSQYGHPEEDDQAENNGEIEGTLIVKYVMRDTHSAPQGAAAYRPF